MTARRVAVTEPLPDRLDRIDYADAFAVPWDGEAPHAVDVARQMFEEAPLPLRRFLPVAWSRLVGLRLVRHGGPANVLGWPILESTPDRLHLGTTSPIVRASLVLRIADGEAVFTSFTQWDRPRATRAVWTVAGPLHRAIVPALLTRAARTR